MWLIQYVLIIYYICICFVNDFLSSYVGFIFKFISLNTHVYIHIYIHMYVIIYHIITYTYIHTGTYLIYMFLLILFTQ